MQTLRTGTRERVSARAGINGAPAFSPDGRMLALTLSRDEGNLDVYTLDLGTQVLRRITESPAIDTEPAWSTDGRSLYFTSDRAGGPQVYRVDAEPGARAQRITYEGTYNTRPRVSPDGDGSRSSIATAATIASRCSTARRCAAGAHERHARRIAELRAERRYDHLCDPRSRQRRARAR